jgi:Na+/phosphate symporter
MLIAWFAVVVMVLGLLLWFVSPNAKLQDMGRILFIIGAFCTVLAAGAKTTIHIP